MFEELNKLNQKLESKILFNHEIGKITWFKTGGKAELFCLVFDEEELKVTKWGTIKINFDTLETNIPGVFAAGDIVRGASLVVWAIKDGREAAISIDKYLENKIKKEQKVA